MAVNLIDNEQIHVIQNGSDITLDIQNDALKNEDVVVGSIRSKNIFDKSKIIDNSFINASTNQINSSTTAKCVYAEIEGGKTYTVSRLAGSRFAIGTSTTLPAINTSLSDIIQDNTASSLTIATRSSAKYLVAYVYNQPSDTLTFQQIIDSLQIEEGTEATAYSPYFSPANEMSDKLSQIAFKTTNTQFTINQYSGINLNNLADQLGVSFIYGTSLTNAPVGALGYIITICILDTAYAKQYFMAPWSGSPEIYTRTKDNGTWSSWYKINAVAL